MELSGLILDVYDDITGGVLRSIFSRSEDVPNLVKQAEALGFADREKLPDNVFALVLQKEGQQLRKFACTDAGNTALAVLYFTKTAHKLPREAQKVAAENLLVACGWYGLEAFAKEAGLLQVAAGAAAGAVKKDPVGAALKATSVPAIVSGTKADVRNRMQAVHQFEGAGGGVATPEQLHHIMGKHAEATGTALMPISAAANKNPASALTTVKKTGAAVMRPHVDVSNKEPPILMQEKMATITACPTSHPGKYPLDTHAQVKQAAAYYEQYAARFPEKERNEFRTNLVKRATALAIPLGEAALEGAKIAKETDWSWADGAVHLNYPMLQGVIKKKSSELAKTFGEEFVKELRVDPIGIFSSLPRDQKRIIAAMAPGTASNTDAP